MSVYVALWWTWTVHGAALLLQLTLVPLSPWKINDCVSCFEFPIVNITCTTLSCCKNLIICNFYYMYFIQFIPLWCTLFWSEFYFHIKNVIYVDTKYVLLIWDMKIKDSDLCIFKGIKLLFFFFSYINSFSDRATHLHTSCVGLHTRFNIVTETLMLMLPPLWYLKVSSLITGWYSRRSSQWRIWMFNDCPVFCRQSMDKTFIASGSKYITKG